LVVWSFGRLLLLLLLLFVNEEVHLQKGQSSEMPELSWNGSRELVTVHIAAQQRKGIEFGWGERKEGRKGKERKEVEGS